MGKLGIGRTAKEQAKDDRHRREDAAERRAQQQREQGRGGKGGKSGKGK